MGITYTIKISNNINNDNAKDNDKTFYADANESILDAALRQGIMLSYGCKNGQCGTCKGKVLQGEYNTLNNLLTNSGDVNSDIDKTQNICLLCSTQAKSDLVIEAKVLQGIGDINIKKLPCRVSSIEKINEDIIILKLQLSSSEQFNFMPGQF